MQNEDTHENEKRLLDCDCLRSRRGCIATDFRSESATSSAAARRACSAGYAKSRATHRGKSGAADYAKPSATGHAQPGSAHHAESSATH